MHTDCSILSIVPYRVLPPTSGGHAGIVYLHDALGKHCQDIFVSTSDNGNNGKYAFTLQAVLPSSPKRYIPFANLSRLKGLAKAYDIRNIYCDHPYMAPTVIALSKSLRIPWYMRSHNIESDRFRTLGKKWWPLMHLFERHAMRSANGVFFVTQEDADWAIKHYNLNPSCCHIIPFGTNLQQAPVGKEHAKQQLATDLNIDVSRPFMYFLGAMNYYPNIQAVNFILDEIIPRLNAKNIPFEILLAGKGLPEAIQQRIKETSHVQYLGFIPDLDIFLNACDIMLNPVLLGGGIKTKAVEALAYNKKVISTHSGAAGLVREACGDNLSVTADHDWDAFAQSAIEAIGAKPNIPGAFFDFYNWDKIAEKILSIMDSNTTVQQPR